MLEVILCTVLYIEDDPDDMFLFERAFSHASIPCDLRCVNSIEQARCYLLGEGEYADRQRFRLPDLIMTDLAVQGESALAFVEWLRNQPTFAKIAVACLTGSDISTGSNCGQTLSKTSHLTFKTKYISFVKIITSR